MTDLPPAPAVSVVVPTYGRPDTLRRCLAALLAQRLAPERYEIVIADDSASAETRRAVEQSTDESGCGCPVVRYVAVRGRHGPAAARNAGWRAARGAVIAFTDDDCLPERGWLCAGLAALGDGAAGASGRLVVPLPCHATDYELNAAQLAHATFVTANCFYRRDALEAVDGFDERFALAWREDSDLHFRLLRARARLVLAPDAVVVHPVRPARWGVSLGQQRKSMYNALLYKQHPALYRKLIQRTPPWHYYAMVGALLLGATELLSRVWPLACVALGVWLVLASRFCAQRLRATTHTPAHVCEMLVTSALIPPLAVFWRLRGAVRFHVWFI